MNVMIFAAGLGTRLRPFTDNHPKALAPVGDLPAIGRNLQEIKKIQNAKIGKVVVNVHHFPDQIRKYISENSFGMPIQISDETDCLFDTGGGLLHARLALTEGLTDDTILLMNADVLTDLPLDDILSNHREGDTDVTLLCSNRNSSRTLWFNSNDRLVGWENLKTGETIPADFASNISAEIDNNVFLDKDITAADLSYSQSPFCGIHVFKASALFPLLQEYADKNRQNNTHNADPYPFPIIPFYLSVLNQLTIRRFLLPPSAQWFDIGSPSKLEEANRFFSKNNINI